MTKVKLERWKNYDYVVNMKDEFNRDIRITWLGAKLNKPTVVAVEQNVYDYLTHYTTTFESGELVVSKDQENYEEVKSRILDVEAYEANAKSKEELIDLLKKANLKKLEAELNKITDNTAKMFTYSVFQDIKEELVGSKIDIVEKWFGPNDDE